MADEVGNAQVAVFPVFTGFRSKVAAEIGGSGRQAGKAFSDAFKTSSASTAPNLAKFKAEVRSATAALSKARLAQQDQAGRVRVAETRLAEAIARSGAGSARAVAAEESLASARRRLQTATDAVSAASSRLVTAQNGVSQATAAAGTAGTASAGRFAQAWQALRSSLPGVVGGAVRESGVRAEGAASSAGRSVGGAFQGGFRSALVTGAAAGVAAALTSRLASAMGGFAREAVAASDATDKFRQTLDFAGLDTGPIKKAIREARQYADQTVYDLSTIQSTAAQLASNGIKDFQGLTEAAGNLNAVAGGTAETYKSVALVVTQTAGAGKLTGDNWRQLAQAIPGASGRIQQALRDNGVFTGSFAEAMRKGTITADAFNQAILDLGSQPVAEEAAKSTKTFEGAIGNLKATVVGGFSDALNVAKPGLTRLINAVTGGISAAFDKVREIGAPFKDVFAGLETVDFGSLLKRFGPLAAALSPLGVVFKAIQPLLPQFAAAAANLGAQLSATLMPVLASLVPLVVDLSTRVAGALGQALASVFPMLVELGSSVIPVLAQVIGAVAPVVAQLVEAFLPLIPIVAQLVQSLLPPIAAIITALGPPISSLLAALVPIVSAVGAIVAQLAQALLPVIDALLPPIVSVVQLLADVLVPVIDVIVGLLNAVLPVVTAVIGVIVQLVAGILRFVAVLVGGLVSGLSSLVQWLVRAAGGFSDWVSGVVSGAADFAGSVGRAVGDVVAWFAGLPGKIVGAVGAVGGLLVNAGRSLVSGFLRGIKASWSTLVGWVKSGMENLRGLWPFSPAKWGPFSGKGYVTHSGKALTDDWAASLSAGQSKVTAAASKLAASAQRPLTAAGGTPAPASTGSGVSTDMVDVLVQALVAVFEARGISILTLSDRLTEVQDRALEMA